MERAVNILTVSACSEVLKMFWVILKSSEDQSLWGDPVSIPQTSLLHHLFVDTQLQEVVKIVECLCMGCMVEHSPVWKHQADMRSIPVSQLLGREGNVLFNDALNI